MGGMRGRQEDSGEAGAIIIDRRYQVFPGTSCGEFAGLPAFAVDQRTQGADSGTRGADQALPSLVAVKARRDAPPPASLPLFLNAYNTALLMPVAHGAGGGDYWIVCDAPPGPSLRDSLTESATPPSEAELASVYLRPLALALGRLHALGLVHRGVRPANLYRSLESGRILLAPGCVMPPAFGQPTIYEPASTGICAPSARGAGLPADDVYALGAVLLELMLGHPLLPDLDDERIVHRKLELGSFQALAGNERLPPVLVSLLRSMLSDDPTARPSLAALAEHGIGAERPKAPRPEPRAPRPLMVGRIPVSTARSLALAFARQPMEAQVLLRSGTVEQWLRRALDLPLLAARITEALRGATDRNADGAEQMVLMQTVALLDPLAPMFWSGRWFWPDAIPAMLAMQLISGPADNFIGEVIRHAALRRWALLTGRSGLQVSEELERRNARASRLPVPALRMPMLAYSLNPFLACTSAALGGACVLRSDQLVTALEAMAKGKAPAARLLDTQMLALLAARSDTPNNGSELTVPSDADERLLDLQGLAQAQLQSRSRIPGEPAPEPLALPKLAASLLPVARERLNNWPGKGRRMRRLERLEKAAEAGDLVEMLELSCRDADWAEDEAALNAARAEADDLRAAHQDSLDDAPQRARQARTAGREVGVMAGVVGLLGAVLVGVLS